MFEVDLDHTYIILSVVFFFQELGILHTSKRRTWKKKHQETIPSWFTNELLPFRLSPEAQSKGCADGYIALQNPPEQLSLVMRRFGEKFFVAGYFSPWKSNHHFLKNIPFSQRWNLKIIPSKKRRNIDPKHQFWGGSMFAFRGGGRLVYEAAFFMMVDLQRLNFLENHQFHTLFPHPEWWFVGKVLTN